MPQDMRYRGEYRKYVEGSSTYAVYVYGDAVKRLGKTYVCSVATTEGIEPENANSGFDLVSLYDDPSPNNIINGGDY